jgi:hypothetical protein
MDVTAKRSDGTRKVVYKTTHIGLPDGDNSIQLQWNGQTNLKQSCDLKLAAYAWRSKRFIVLVTGSVGETPDTTITAIRTEDGSRFVNRNGKAKVRVSCVDNAGFTLKTDRVIVTS